MKTPRSIAVILWANASFFTLGCGDPGQCDPNPNPDADPNPICEQGPKGDKGDKGDPGVCEPGMCQGSSGSEPAGVVSCLPGYSRVGPEGARGSFCITQQQQEAERFFDAKDVCWAQGDDTARPHVCTLDEWYIACTQEADVGQPPITNMADDDEETVADVSGAGAGIVVGLSSCSSLSTEAFTSSRPYRCCYK